MASLSFATRTSLEACSSRIAHLSQERKTGFLAPLATGIVARLLKRYEGAAVATSGQCCLRYSEEEETPLAARAAKGVSSKDKRKKQVSRTSDQVASLVGLGSGDTFERVEKALDTARRLTEEGKPVATSGQCCLRYSGTEGEKLVKLATFVATSGQCCLRYSGKRHICRFR